MCGKNKENGEKAAKQNQIVLNDQIWQCMEFGVQKRKKERNNVKGLEFNLCLCFSCVLLAFSFHKPKNLLLKLFLALAPRTNGRKRQKTTEKNKKKMPS